MKNIDFTVVLGVDQKTIELLKIVYPTWLKCKSSLLKNPFVIFTNGVKANEVSSILKDVSDATYVDWPPVGVEYPRDGIEKWDNPQRAKMLAGFVHVPAQFVETPYWLKLDLDVVATGNDNWVDPGWFDGDPAIIAPGWNYTKPATQMLKLDEWAARHKPKFLDGTPPMDLKPEPGSDLVKHPRICSWCAFFNTEFTRMCSVEFEKTCGIGQLPVDSQDGALFYAAKRGGYSIRVVSMKRHGWMVRGTYSGVKSMARDVLQ